ncbi:hypothetical protein AYL99_11576 [Fonsecaea erecta]|uniref:Uncharacterized protein n=1 Tax=Fonsecaea erecta TaxID=1367422 RepID=A0A178Z5Y8_9EURO|nr:hypothetical protein AYL99_11576 [Fonsecaea erecta]OAP54475.1 hypothetical protein AYL99_11576 [Fonsecaea erecta]
MAATRAGTTDNDQRSESTTRLNRTLDARISSIPPPFRPSSVLQAGQPGLRRSFVVIHPTHLAGRTQVYRAHAMTSRWIQSLQSFGWQDSYATGTYCPDTATNTVTAGLGETR